MPASAAQSVFCCGTDRKNRTSDEYLARFQCYVIYNLAIACGYAAMALINYLAAAVACCFLIDGALLAWISSLTSRHIGSRKLQCVASLSLFMGVLSLIAAVGLQGWLGWSASGLGTTLWRQGLAVPLFTLVVCISKSLTLLAANSFRLWLLTRHPTSLAVPEIGSPGGRDTPPALAVLQESPEDRLVTP